MSLSGRVARAQEGMTRMSERHAPVAEEMVEPRSLMVAGEEIPLTEREGERIRAALVRYLRRALDGDVEDREMLLRDTENAPILLSGGRLRVGVWLLEQTAGQIVMRNRLPATARSIVAYVASMRRDDADWSVSEITKTRSSLG